MAELVKQDRAGEKQGKYAARLGLSQFQVSELENRRMRRLSADVAEKLQKRFGSIPEIDMPAESAGPYTAAPGVANQVRAVVEHVERELTRALINAPPSKHAAIVQHFQGQVTLLADLASTVPIHRATGTGPDASTAQASGGKDARRPPSRRHGPTPAAPKRRKA